MRWNQIVFLTAQQVPTKSKTDNTQNIYVPALNNGPTAGRQLALAYLISNFKYVFELYVYNIYNYWGRK